MNPVDWELCGECGSPIERTPEMGHPCWYRSKWITWAAALGAVAAVSATAGVLGSQATGTDTTARPSADVQELIAWWSNAEKSVLHLRQSLKDSQQALIDVDRGAMRQACEQMHDTAAVELGAQLPAPTPLITSELRAAAEDAHAASHMCLAVLAGSTNSYGGEFPAAIEQAEQHLGAAKDLILHALTGVA